MRTRFIRIIAMLLLVAAAVFGFAIPASALDNTYRFDSLEMSVKLPKSYDVITPDTPRGDEVFEKVDLDYDETMTAFRAANIYLRAYDAEKTYQISMTVTKNESTAAVNNYADLTSVERNAILETIQSDGSVSSAVEKKLGGNIFFVSEWQTTDKDDTVYIQLCNTIINGMQIDLMLQKGGELITADEAKVLTNAASSLSFDNIRRNTGPVFDWWRLLLWAVILAALSVAVSFVYKQYNAANKRELEERRNSRRATVITSQDDEPAHAEERQLTFEEALGYKDDEEFAVRADADEMASYDISVKEKDPNKGVAFFEDEGSGIDDGTDYFDTYFKEPVERRTAAQRFFSAVGSYLKIAAKHTGYFFRNLFKTIFGKNNK